MTRSCVFEGLKSRLGTQIPTPTSGAALASYVLGRTPANFPAFVTQLHTCRPILPEILDPLILAWMSALFPLESLFVQLYLHQDNRAFLSRSR